MKICGECGNRHDDPGFRCPLCGHEPESISGYPAFAPDLARENNFYDPAAHAYLADHEKEHFWFRNRNALLIWALNEYFRNAKRFCEVGCGTGFVLSEIERERPALLASGCEIYSDQLPIIQNRVPNADLFQVDIRDFPFEREFDVIGAFDVIEHIEEDESALENMYKAIKPGGGALVTVPHHKWMWSREDEKALHKRRYTKREIARKLRAAGFLVLRMTAFISFPLPFMIFSRFIMKNKEKSPKKAEFEISPAINRIFLAICRAERKIIQRKVDFSMGGSLLVVASKPREGERPASIRLENPGRRR